MNKYLILFIFFTVIQCFWFEYYMTLASAVDTNQKAILRFHYQDVELKDE